MAQVRVFQIEGITLSEIPEEHIVSVRWVDNLSAQPEATIQLSPAAELTPAGAPNHLIIIPSARQNVVVPAYGPYQVSGPYSWDGAVYTLRGAIGVDFAARFATDDNAALEAIVSQVEAFSSSSYEPFLGWATEPIAGGSPNVANLGIDFITGLVQSALFNVGSLSDLEGLLANFGLVAYMLAEWPASGFDATERLAIWPIHPIQRGEGYFIGPTIGTVSRWNDNLPETFAAPRTILPNRATISEYANVAQFPNIRVPDMFNAPFGSNKPNYRNRRINVGYRLLGVEQEIELFHTGNFVPVIFRTPHVVNISGSAKMEEEIQRWNLQNGAAELSLKRFPGDSWDTVADAFNVPHQIVAFPEQVFPKGWPETQREFVIREVNHEFSATEGYSQTISATLWQGPFERVLAETDDD